MPGVTVLSAQSALPSGAGSTKFASTSAAAYHAPMQNGLGGSPRSAEEHSVRDIKDKAQRDARNLARGATAISLIRAARSQVLHARDAELDGHQKQAFGAYIRAASLVKMFMDTAEFKAEGKKGVLWKEFMDFQQYDGSNIKQRTEDLEAKLTEMEKSAVHANGMNGNSNGNMNGNGADADDGPSHKSGGSIADRMRALQDAGMQVAPAKPLRELPTVPTSPPGSPRKDRHQPAHQQHLSLQTALAPQPPQPPQPPQTLQTLQPSSSAMGVPPSSGILPSASVSVVPPSAITPLQPLSSFPSGLPSALPSSVTSPLVSSASASASAPFSSPVATSFSPAHSFVPLSTLGPPSPPPSPPPSASSPRISQAQIDQFSQQFPAIDELDELQGLHLSGGGAGGGGGTISNAVSASGFSRGVAHPQSHPQPLALDSRSSRPVSPSRTSPKAFSSSSFPPVVSSSGATSPIVPHKPSVMSLKSASASTSTSPVPGRSPRMGYSTPPSQGDKPELPVSNTVFPRALYEYMNHPGVKVLLLDVRSREEYEREHIQASAVVCLEPMVLQRDLVSSSMLEDSLSVGPRDERVLFQNREKFDLVVMYDADSDAFGDPGSSVFLSLSSAIYETEFRKILKKMPVLLVGGLKAWKRDMGEGPEVLVKGDNVATPSANGHGPPAATATAMNGIGAAAGVNGVNGTNGVDTMNGMKSPTNSMHARMAAQSNTESMLINRGRAQTESQGSAAAAAAATVKPVSTPPSREFRPLAEGPPTAGPSRPLPETNVDLSQRLARRPALSRPPSQHFHPAPVAPAPITQAMSGPSSISYPQFSSPPSSNHFGSSQPQQPPNGHPPSSFQSSRDHFGLVSPPPQASINPSPLSRRRSDYVDQSQEALTGSGLAANGQRRTPIDYPDLSAHHVLRPPPAAAASPLSERQDPRPARILQQQQPGPVVPTSSTPPVGPGAGPKPPTIQSEYPVQYWGDLSISPAGLKNMGNTCYMNSTIQCLNATAPFARFFLDGRWRNAVNMLNPLGTKGVMADGFTHLLKEMNKGDAAFLSPIQFRRMFVSHAPQFDGADQHDCQEFLSTLLDGLHEDLNRVLHRPNNQITPEREAQLERLPQQIASEQEWCNYRLRNDSLVVDYFQGQFRNRLECMTCHKTSTTYNAFMYLTLPIPSKTMSKVTIQHCLDAFVKEEIMEKSDAWNCPHCKTLRRATKQLSLSRLPPILLIHLKRFSSKGSSTDKIETFVDFPIKGLDLTNYMPPPLPPGVDPGVPGAQQLAMDDPRRQLPPYRYDLYAVTNHFGSLSGGHYTAHASSRGQWLYCDDSRVVPADAKDVVGKPAYVLFYKRVKA